MTAELSGLRTLQVTIGDTAFRLQTRPTLFSPRYPDPGTLAMLSAVTLDGNDRLLDLGCGYGLVGIFAARRIGDTNVTMVDIDPVAVEVASANAAANDVSNIACVVSDGFEALDDTGYTKILSNPPYHTDFSVAKNFILKGFNRLTVGGEMWFVTKREKWYRNKLKSVFGGATVQTIDGYSVLCAQKRRESYASRR